FMLRVIAICWIATKLLSYKLWLADRLFPTVPVNDILYAVPNSIHLLLFLAMLFLLILLIIFPQKKWISAVLIFVEIISCLMDENRWQPWEYQFSFMLLIFLLS